MFPRFACLFSRIAAWLSEVKPGPAALVCFFFSYIFLSTLDTNGILEITLLNPILLAVSSDIS